MFVAVVEFWGVGIIREHITKGNLYNQQRHYYIWRSIIISEKIDVFVYPHWLGSHRNIVQELDVFVIRVNSIGAARRQALYLSRRVVEQNGV